VVHSLHDLVALAGFAFAEVVARHLEQQAMIGYAIVKGAFLAGGTVADHFPVVDVLVAAAAVLDCVGASAGEAG
jgi:hypothetical protein